MSKDFGYLPYGTVIKYGIYAIMSLGTLGPVEIYFKDAQPMVPDQVDHTSLNQLLWSDSHPILSIGIAQGLVSSSNIGGANFDNRGRNPARGAGVKYNTRFTMVFGEHVNPLGPETELGVTCVDTPDDGTYMAPGGSNAHGNMTSGAPAKATPATPSTIKAGGSTGTGDDDDDRGQAGEAKPWTAKPWTAKPSTAKPSTAGPKTQPTTKGAAITKATKMTNDFGEGEPCASEGC